MAHATTSITVKFDVAEVREAFRRMARSADAFGRALADIVDPPSQQRRELRLIAAVHRAEAQVWWEQHKAAAR